MEDKDSLIAQLRNEIRTRNEEIYIAATYGNQLVAEKSKLSRKVDELLVQNEILVQEKHSLQLDLETQIQAVESQTSELELQREQVDNLNERLQRNEKESEALQKKNQNLSKENLYLKKMQEDLNVENSSLNEKIDLLLKQINNFESQTEKSMNETYRDDPDLQSQLNAYMLNNKELQNALSQSQFELEAAKKNEKHLLQMVHDLEETVSEKNAEISACNEEIKKAKEEIEELQGEIEILKYDQIDVNKRGNSVFAELDDRRSMVEKEYKTLRKKYEQFQKDYEEKKVELDRARGQMAILQSMTSRDYQQSYIDSLEDSLSSARKEIHDLMLKLTKAMKVKEERKSMEQSFSTASGYEYLKEMLQISQKKERELQDEVVNLKSKIMYDNDDLIKAQQRLYKVKDDLHNAKQEIFKLKQEIKELQLGIMRNLPAEPVQKPKIEIVGGFKPPAKVNEKTDLLNKSIFNDVPDFNIIPGEIELGEDGFRKVKPPRKSNRFILQEFNRVEPGEKSEELIKSDSKKIDYKETTCEQKVLSENLQIIENCHPKSSKKKNDNCAQQ